MFNYFKNKRKKLINDIAYEVVNRLENQRGWKEFLPPVVMRDSVYIMTKDGSIYALRQDSTGIEVICTIRQ